MYYRNKDNYCMVRRPPTWVIYKLQNLLNGRIYIGLTKNFKARMNCHKTSGELYLNEAINEDGWDNFTKEVIHIAIPTKQEAVDLEEHYILLYNSLAPYGYNVKKRDGNTSPDTILKQARAHQGRQRGRYRHKYVGVRPTPHSTFTTMIRIDGVIHSKTYENETEAAMAYDRVAILIYGEGAKLNFPDLKGDYLEENLDAFLLNFVTKTYQSQFYGVSRRKTGWAVTIKQKKFNSFFGLTTFEKEEDAALIVDQIRVAYSLKCKKPFNFPDLVDSHHAQDLYTLFESKRPSKKTLRNIRRKGSKFYVYVCRNKINNLVGIFHTVESAILARDSYLNDNN